MADSAGNGDHHYKFNVKMTCGGCSGAVERVLKKTEGTIFIRFLPAPSSSSFAKLYASTRYESKALSLHLILLLRQKLNNLKCQKDTFPAQTVNFLKPFPRPESHSLLFPWPLFHYSLHSPSSLPAQATTNHFLNTGISSYNISLENQTADVYTADVPYETVLETIKKTGKTVLSAQKDGVDVGV